MSVRLPPAPIRGNPGDFIWESWYNDLQGTFYNFLKLNKLATDPTAADIPVDSWGVFKNTTTGITSLWINDGGVVSRTHAFALANP